MAALALQLAERAVQAHGPGSRNHAPHTAQRVMKLHSAGFRGNKAALPSKPCAGCGRPMSWRRNWAKNWAEVKFCSEPCRRGKGRSA